MDSEELERLNPVGISAVVCSYDSFRAPPDYHSNHPIATAGALPGGLAQSCTFDRV